LKSKIEGVEKDIQKLKNGDDRPNPLQDVGFTKDQYESALDRVIDKTGEKDK